MKYKIGDNDYQVGHIERIKTIEEIKGQLNMSRDNEIITDVTDEDYPYCPQKRD